MKTWIDKRDCEMSYKLKLLTKNLQTFQKEAKCLLLHLK